MLYLSLEKFKYLLMNKYFDKLFFSHYIFLVFKYFDEKTVIKKFISFTKSPFIIYLSARLIQKTYYIFFTHMYTDIL